jgi:hypothetical protein
MPTAARASLATLNMENPFLSERRNDTAGKMVSGLVLRACKAGFKTNQGLSLDAMPRRSKGQNNITQTPPVQQTVCDTLTRIAC